MISILILTLNEEENLPGCMRSVAWSDDIVVLDSFSTDRTMDVAKAAGARVVQRRFDDFASQRNYALDHVEFKYRWVFHLDADERFTEPLRAECVQAVAVDSYSGFMVPSKLVFLGRWLKHAGCYPNYQMRLVKPGEARFIQHGHGQRETDARRGLGSLREPYLHLNFSKGFSDWLDKHNRYSTHEAAESLKSVASGQWSLAGCLKELMRRLDPVVRRRALKELSFRLPCRPLLRFLYMYILRLGFLDGLPGYHYCRLLSIYEYMIVLKMKEIQRRQLGQAL